MERGNPKVLNIGARSQAWDVYFPTWWPAAGNLTFKRLVPEISNSRDCYKPSVALQLLPTYRPWSIPKKLGGGVGSLQRGEVLAMGPIRAEWFKAKCLIFSLLFLNTLRSYIESAPARPNKYYHTVGVDTFQFRFPAEEPFSNSSEKSWGIMPKRNGGVTKLLQHNIHSTMINSTNSTHWMKNVVLQSLAGDKTRADAIMAAGQKLHAGAGLSAAFRPRPWSSARTTVPLASGILYGTNFIVRVRLGKRPKQEIKMSLDTANDVSWLWCNYRGRSSSFKKLTCDSCDSEVNGLSCHRNLNQCIYQVEYEDGTGVTAHLSEDRLWLGSRPFRKFSFGCLLSITGSTADPSVGLLAMSRNYLSVPSQTDYLYQRKFSYCLPDYLRPRQRGSLRLGRGSVPPTSKFTSLLSNPRAPSWYFVGIRSIRVGGKRLNVSSEVFQFNSRGGGTIIDSGVLVSRLVKPAYDALRDEFVKRMPLVTVEPDLQNPLDTCFAQPSDFRRLKIPGISFHFQDGAHIHIHKKGILVPVENNQICLAFQPAGTNDLNIIGSLQQQRYIVSFDEHHERIGFASVRSCF